MAIVILLKTAIVVPQQSAFVVERLGVLRHARAPASTSWCRSSTCIRYKHSLKEQALDIPAQICITRDNVQVASTACCI